MHEKMKGPFFNKWLMPNFHIILLFTLKILIILCCMLLHDDYDGFWPNHFNQWMIVLFSWSLSFQMKYILAKKKCVFVYILHFDKFFRQSSRILGNSVDNFNLTSYFGIFTIFVLDCIISAMRKTKSKSIRRARSLEGEFYQI